MKLLFIAPSAYLLGGVQDWLYMLTIGLRNRGHNVIVAVPDNNYHRLNRYNEYFKGIDAVPFVNRTGTPEGRIRALCSCLIKNRAEIIVAVNIGDVYEAFSRVKKRLGDSRLVMTIHAIEANYFADLNDYHSIIDAVITTNRLTELIIKKGNAISSNRIYYAPYGVHEAEGTEEVRRDYECLRLAWVGRIENRQKRASDLYGILEELDKLGVDYTLGIAGTGEIHGDLERGLEDWVKNGKVEFYGVLRKEEMPSFYSKHNVLLITSQWETGPIVAWEAMSYGLAVVSSEYIGSRAEKTLIHNETALLYPIGETKEAALQIKRLVNQDLRKDIAESGRAIAISRYSALASIVTWEYTFESIMRLRNKVQLSFRVQKRRPASGRLESLVGTYISEKIRHLLPPAVTASSAGSEWPHSLQNENEQSSVLKLAEEIETASTSHWSIDI